MTSSHTQNTVTDGDISVIEAAKQRFAIAFTQTALTSGFSTPEEELMQRGQQVFQKKLSSLGENPPPEAVMALAIAQEKKWAATKLAQQERLPETVGTQTPKVEEPQALEPSPPPPPSRTAFIGIYLAHRKVTGGDMENGQAAAQEEYKALMLQGGAGAVLRQMAEYYQAIEHKCSPPTLLPAAVYTSPVNGKDSSQKR